MREVSKLEERVALLTSLRKNEDPDMNKERAYKSLLSSNFGKVVVMDLIERYIKAIGLLEKMEDNDVAFYELKGQLTMVDWLLNTIKENLVEEKRKEV